MRGEERFCQTGFAALSGVAMDDSAFRRFVDRRDETAHAILILLPARTSDTFLHFAESREHSSITKGALRCLAGALGGGFGIGHEIKDENLRAGRFAARESFVNPGVP